MHSFIVNTQLFFMVFLALLLTAGCATRGNLSTATTKISESRKAISVAREDSTGPNIPVQLKNAEDKLKQATLAFTNEEYLVAARLAEKATVDADCARIETKAAAAMQETEQMRQNIQSLRQDLERMAR